MHKKCPAITEFTCEYCGKKGKCEDGVYICEKCKYFRHLKCPDNYTEILVIHRNPMNSEKSYTFTPLSS